MSSPSTIASHVCRTECSSVRCLVRYDHERHHVASLRVFDVFNVVEGRYLDYDKAREFADFVGLDWVPELFRSRWCIAQESDLLSFCEGRSMIASNVREGFIVKPLRERYDDELGRVILKMRGEGFLTRKGG